MDAAAEKRKRDGIVIIIVAALSIFLWFIISDGYIPEWGFGKSFLERMTVYKDWVFCERVPTERFGSPTGLYHNDCWEIVIKTKYLVFVSLCVLGYGVMVYKGIVGNPKQLADSFVDRLKAKKNH